jgi:hypothetical protein
MLVAVGLLAACSSSSSPTPSAAGDKALAKQELLPASDYPLGWKGQGASSENTEASFFGGSGSSYVAQMTSCLGITMKNVDTKPVEAADQEYDDPNSNVTVTDTVDVFPTVAGAIADVGAEANAKTPGCFTQMMGPKLSQEFSQKLGQGATIGTLSVTDVSLASYGDHHSAVVVSFPFTYQGVSATLYMEEVTVQKDRSESNFQFINTGSAVPVSIVDRLARDSAARMS